jgi:hypothetical protein
MEILECEGDAGDEYVNPQSLCDGQYVFQNNTGSINDPYLYLPDHLC